MKVSPSIAKKMEKNKRKKYRKFQKNLPKINPKRNLNS